MERKTLVLVMRYAQAIFAAAIVFVVVAVAEGFLIGQSLDGIRNPTWIETTILIVGQLAIPLAAAAWAFIRVVRWPL